MRINCKILYLFLRFVPQNFLLSNQSAEDQQQQKPRFWVLCPNPIAWCKIQLMQQERLQAHKCKSKHMLLCMCRICFGSTEKLSNTGHANVLIS